VTATHRPLVVLTSNRSRELSEALKRRCLHLQLDYPSSEVELEIVRLKAPDIREALAAELVQTIQRLRTVDLRKAPSIGETLDWAQALVVLGADSLSKELIEETLSVIVKYDRDADKARRALQLNGATPDHAHDHEHGHHHHH
jgi:MoxR-like ATPase